jgi:hypothetical protein
MRRNIMLVAASCVVLAGCDVLGVGCNTPPRDQSRRVTIQEGVWGQVWLWRGNFEPRPVGAGCTSGTIDAVDRWVLIYEPTPTTHATRAGTGGFYSSVQTALVDSVRSDAQGFFQRPLAPGSYSLFVRVDSLLYANQISGPPHAGILGRVHVESGAVTRIQLDIEHEKMQ